MDKNWSCHRHKFRDADGADERFSTLSLRDVHNDVCVSREKAEPVDYFKRFLLTVDMVMKANCSKSWAEF